MGLGKGEMLVVTICGCRVDACAGSVAVLQKPPSSSSTSSALAHQGGFRRAEDRAIFDDCDPEAPPTVSVGVSQLSLCP